MSLTKQTKKYIDENQAIKKCLKKGLINYSALARLVKNELKLEDANEDSILVAARRYKDDLIKRKNSSEVVDEKLILEIFRKSSTLIKNNMISFIIEKNIYPDSLIEIERKAKKKKDLFFAIEGTKTITIITEKVYKEDLMRFKNKIVSKDGLKEDLSLITITSNGIQETSGCISYLTTLFYDNQINIEQFMSCYDDTLILVRTKELPKVLGKFF